MDGVEPMLSMFFYFLTMRPGLKCLICICS